MNSYEKRGYLDRDFRLFRLKGPTEEPVGYHYHDFHKILILQKGRLDYLIEGRSCHLHPHDIVLVGRHTVHRPENAHRTDYERTILYVSPSFLDIRTPGGCDLNRCFLDARTRHSDVLRPDPARMQELLSLLSRLENAGREDGFARELYCRLLFLEFMVGLNRAALEQPAGNDSLNSGAGSGVISAVLRYLADHLAEDFTIDELAARFYISKYHMMRLFRQETGYTVHGYITEKRLLSAAELLQQGASVADACLQSGFRNYAAFLRAYKKKYGAPPRSLASLSLPGEDALSLPTEDAHFGSESRTRRIYKS